MVFEMERENLTMGDPRAIISSTGSKYGSKHCHDMKPDMGSSERAG